MSESLTEAQASPQRVQLRRTKGWKMPPNTVKVDRTTKFGNPYPVTTTPDNAVAAYEQWLNTSLPGQEIKALAKSQLRGMNLACWCPLDRPCHASVLLRIANE